MSKLTKALILTIISMVNVLVRNIALCVCVEHTKKLDSNPIKELDETAQGFNQLYLCIADSAKDAYSFWHSFTSSSAKQFRHIKTLSITVQLLSRSLVELAYALRVSALSMISFYRYAPGNKVITRLSNAYANDVNVQIHFQQNSNHHLMVAVFFMCIEKGNALYRGIYVYCLCCSLSNGYRPYLYGSRSIRNDW